MSKNILLNFVLQPPIGCHNPYCAFVNCEMSIFGQKNNRVSNIFTFFPQKPVNAISLRYKNSSFMIV